MRPVILKIVTLSAAGFLIVGGILSLLSYSIVVTRVVKPLEGQPEAISQVFKLGVVFGLVTATTIWSGFVIAVSVWKSSNIKQ